MNCKNKFRFSCVEFNTKVADNFIIILISAQVYINCLIETYINFDFNLKIY